MSSTCSGELASSLAICVSVVILVGIRLSARIPKRSDVLCARSVGRHDEDVFVKEALIGRSPLGRMTGIAEVLRMRDRGSLKETAG